MADTYAGLPIAGTVSAPSVFTHPPVRRHRDARGGSAVDDAMAGDITLCSHSGSLSIQNFPKTDGGDGGCAQSGRRRAPMAMSRSSTCASGIRYVSNRVIGNLLT